MATFRKTKTGTWRAEVARHGTRKSKVFPTKRAAQDWAARQEYLILNGGEAASRAPFSDLLDRYSREVSTKKRGARWEHIRLEKLNRDEIASIALADLRPSDFAAWRDRRLSEVAPATVIREMQLMNSALIIAIKEWGLLSDNPMSGVGRPSKPPARDRRPSSDELEKLQHAAGVDLTKATARAFHAFKFAIETAMRAGEIVGLTWDRVDLDRRVARLTHTKNGRPRDVPLSSEAIRLLEALPEADPVFALKSSQLDALWRKTKERAMVEGLTFHDSRHEAITRLSRKLDVLALARMVGHSDLRQLQTYYNETAEDLAKRLD